MAETILQNRVGNGRAVVHMTGTETVNLAELAKNGETVLGAKIIGVWWSGSWTIVRNAVSVLVLTGNGDMVFDQHGVSIDLQKAQPLVCTLTTGTGSLILMLRKEV